MKNEFDPPSIHYVFHSIGHYDYSQSTNWLRTYWTTSFTFVVPVYLALVYAGQRLMRNRQPFELRKLLFLWNLCLAIFSLIGSYHFWIYIYEIWRDYGFQGTVCTHPTAATALTSNGVNVRFWSWLFGLSKVVELGDTLFIVLRKQKLIFLHWYHHITVLVYTWYSLGQLSSTGNWFLTMNYTVHTAMYAYYALRAAKMRVPQTVAMVITTGQIGQMIVGLYVNWRAFSALVRREKCDVGYENIASSLVMYASYWILFAHLFYANYLRKDLRKKYV